MPLGCSKSFSPGAMAASWTEMPVVGHFAALEQPRAPASDTREGLSVFR
jgi:hypothetical protein